MFFDIDLVSSIYADLPGTIDPEVVFIIVCRRHGTFSYSPENLKATLK